MLEILWRLAMLVAPVWSIALYTHSLCPITVRLLLYSHFLGSRKHLRLKNCSRTRHPHHQQLQLQHNTTITIKIEQEWHHKWHDNIQNFIFQKSEFLTTCCNFKHIILCTFFHFFLPWILNLHFVFLNKIKI